VTRASHPLSAGAVSPAVLQHAVLLCALLAPILPAAAQPTAPAAGSPVQRVAVWRQAGVTSLSLGNGVDVHLRQMPKGNAGRVTLAALVPAVELDETAQTRGSAMLAIDAMKPAAGPARLRVTQRPEGLLITGSCATSELEAALKQIAATLADPVFDAKAFREAQERSIALTRASEARADRRAADAMLRLMTADDPRLLHPTVAQLAAVEFDVATAGVRRSLATRAIDVAAVGDIDAPPVGPAAAAALGVLPARARERLAEQRSVKRLPLAPDAADAVATGTRPMLTVSLPAPGIVELNESRVSSVAARLMERQVAEALRGSGITVSATSGVAMTGRTYPALGTVIGSFTLSGDEPLLRGAAGVARARIARLVDEGPTQAQTRRAADDASEEVSRRVETADYWSQSLAMAWFLQVPVDELGTAPAAIAAVTPETLRQHMTRWWKPELIVTVTIVPGPGEAPAPAELPAPHGAPAAAPR